MKTCSRCKDCDRCDGCEIEPCENESNKGCQCFSEGDLHLLHRGLSELLNDLYNCHDTFNGTPMEIVQIDTDIENTLLLMKRLGNK